MTVAFTLVIAIFLLAMLGTVVQAAGLVDDTVNVANEYSRYPLENYQLDFYVDNSWGWLPWNWSDGIGKQVMYGLYAITNFIWTISLYVSNATGYLVQEAYSLDFISATADSIGKNMQTLAGVSANGFSTEGFYVGFLLLLILVLGVYVAYTGLIKRETTKAIHAIMNFVLVFILSASFIAYAPDYIKKINDFSSDISNASLSLGTKIVMPHSDSQGKDSVDLIRDSLFSIQVQQPWLLLQYNSSDIESIGIDRVESLLSTSPDSNNGEDREKIVAEEIEDRSNTNLTITKTINRLGTVFFLFVFNIGISIFVFLLTGIMIFSQVLFIIYAMFLPVSFILSMIPSFDGMSKRAITKLFNTILTRAGITLIITTAFSISTMLYTLSAGYPFFLIAFLQIVTFAGIYFKLGDLMSMFSLQSTEPVDARNSRNKGEKPLRSVALKWNRSNRKNSLLLLFMKDRLQDKNNIMMNRPQNSLIFRLHIRNLNKPNKSVQQLSPIFQVQKWNAKAIPFKKKPFKSQQLQPLQQIELHNVQSQKNVRLLFKEYHYKIQEVDHQSKPPPLRKSVRNHEVENFSDWWFWIILDGLLTASVCCHFIFR